MKSYFLSKAESFRMAAKATPELDFSPPLPAEGKTKQERFDDYDAKNPQVLKNIVIVMRQRIEDGERPSVKDAFETLRRKYAVHTRSEENPKGKRYNLNNNLAAFYNHKIPKLYPEFIGVLEQRKQRAY